MYLGVNTEIYFEKKTCNAEISLFIVFPMKFATQITINMQTIMSQYFSKGSKSGLPIEVIHTVLKLQNFCIEAFIKIVQMEKSLIYIHKH